MAQEKIIDLEGEIGVWYQRPVNVIDVALIRRTIPNFKMVERVHAHIIIHPEGGKGRHMVDFALHELKPGAVIHVQPGQVQQWQADAGFSGQVLVVKPEAIPRGLFDASSPVASDLGERRGIVDSIVAELVREQAAEDASDAVMESLAAVVFHEIARASSAAQPAASSGTELPAAFRKELENSYSKTRAVSYYARVIGVSPKSLNRLTRELVGLSAKEVIDARVALEARRMLAHTSDTVAAIGDQLGFGEATNFTKFFTRNVGVSPSQFRNDL